MHAINSIPNAFILYLCNVHLISNKRMISDFWYASLHSNIYLGDFHCRICFRYPIKKWTCQHVRVLVENFDTYVLKNRKRSFLKKFFPTNKADYTFPIEEKDRSKKAVVHNWCGKWSWPVNETFMNCNRKNTFHIDLSRIVSYFPNTYVLYFCSNAFWLINKFIKSAFLRTKEVIKKILDFERAQCFLHNFTRLFKTQNFFDNLFGT